MLLPLLVIRENSCSRADTAPSSLPGMRAEILTPICLFLMPALHVKDEVLYVQNNYHGCSYDCLKHIGIYRFHYTIGTGKRKTEVYLPPLPILFAMKSVHSDFQNIIRGTFYGWNVFDVTDGLSWLSVSLAPWFTRYTVNCIFT
jgi:hypothetical protein